MKRLAYFLLIFIFMLSLCGCTKEEVTPYNLNIISPSFAEIHSHYAPGADENNKYVLANSESYPLYLTEERLPVLNSLTICDESISSETAQEITDLCKQYNVPVFFLMNDILQEITAGYDKAFCISADYTYIGERFAEKINSLWEDAIIDKDGDRIFSFSVVAPETISAMQQSFYDNLIKNIELLGIPLSQLEETHISRGDVLEYCNNNKKKNEAFVILDSSYISLFPDNYQPHKSGIEILGMEFGVENEYIEYPYMLLCFINYTQYFDAKDAVMENINAKVYPFKDIEYNVIDKNIYIQPEI